MNDSTHDLDAARFIFDQLQEAGASRRTIARARDMIDQAEREIHIKASIPAVEPPEGSIVEFRRRFVRSRTIYSYVGARRGNKWYFTGRWFRGDWLTWTDLVQRITECGDLFEGFNLVRVGSQSNAMPTDDRFSEPDQFADDGRHFGDYC
jgi:hypothetical protein